MPSLQPQLPRSSARAAAFTAVEVLIVVVLIGIMAAVAVPMVGNRSDLKLAASARILLADLQYAQNLALASRESIYIRFEANKYTVCRKVGSSLTAITHPIDRMNFIVLFNDANSNPSLRGVTIAKPNWSGNNVLGFDSLGVPFTYNETSDTKTVYTTRVGVTLSCSGQTQLMYVEPNTGEVSIP